MKTCFKCKQAKPLDHFYKHPMMADGYLGKCKMCTKVDARRRYNSKRKEVAAYERQRAQTPERRQKVLEYQRKRRIQNPSKSTARNAVSNAIRDGRLTREPCNICGDPKSQAHHHDYSKPFDVKWLCFRHHRETHGQIPF